MTSSNNRIFRSSIYFVAFVALVSCLAPINVETDMRLGQLIITGQVSTVPHRNFVQVARTAGTAGKPLDVSGAVVWIVDGAGNKTACFEASPGIYKANAFAGSPGTTYHVEVDVNNGHYESAPETLPGVIGTEELTFDFDQQATVDKDGAIATRDFINIRTKVNVPTAAAPWYLRWDVSESWLIVPTDFPDPFGYVPPSCYVTQAPDPQRIMLFNGNTGTSFNQQILIASRLADKQSFHTKHVFYIYQCSMTPTAYEYWRKVNVLVNQVGSIFDTPPAEITGNVKNTSNPTEVVYGYFQANNENYNRIRVATVDMPFVPVAYCEYDAGKRDWEYPYECLRCLDYPNSSLVEPELFKN